MLAIFRKEIQSFFANTTGVLVPGLFLLLTGLFLWVFKNPFNIFDYGFADLSRFFLLTPWIFLMLIPAITMKSLAEERHNGTLELLLIKPISTVQLVLGKWLGCLTLSIMAVAPTFVYVFALSALGTSESNYDKGVLMGSYFGLLLLIAAYTSIGVFASSLSKNQVVAFLLGVALCFLVYFGFESLATLSTDGQVQQILYRFGAKAHFETIGLGVIDTKDLVYFVSLTLFFGYLTVLNLQKTNK